MSDISTKLVALYNSRDHDEVLTISLAEIERLHDQTNAYRADIEREVTAHVTTIQTLNQQDAEIERLRAWVRELRGALGELRTRLHAAGRRPEECYEMRVIDDALGWRAGDD